ncbi:MAG TPA: ankyrin repeat domain-containing protein, partial [Reyranella sp.]|nr:ankyrin repeat domain-containing protein [Reyranella sp.]
MPQALPANPNLDWLKKTTKQRLVQLRTSQPDAKLHQVLFAVAHDYGFKSWRALKSHVDSISATFRVRDRVFEAARTGNVEAVRRAFASGFDPATPDSEGRTVLQIAKDRRHEAIEVLARNLQGGKTRPDGEIQAIQATMRAAQSGDLGALRAGLDAHPEWIDALGGGFQKATALHLAVLRNQHAAARLLIERGADLNRREFPYNAAPLHFAAAHGDLEMIRLLVEAGADVDGKGDDQGVGVLGWATCFGDLRQEVATYLLDHGAKLDLWTAISLDRADDLHAMVAGDRSLLTARMTRNQH